VVRPIRRGDTGIAMIVIEDITQQRAAQRASHAFVAQATHELRTPLTNICLYVETALDEGENDPKVRQESLNVINTEARRLERMVGDILSMSEIEAGALRLRRDDVRTKELFAELQADYMAQAREKQIDLSFQLPPKLPVLLGDRDKISLGLHNLVGNAIKYTPEGGKITVCVTVEGDMLSMEVSDTGIGISEEDCRHIFDRFYRAKDRRVGEVTGSGLGLAIAREVIALHGGDITVRSEPNKGSTFTLLLPVNREAA
jgi:signal transduction histidine kinase